jgi:hypothetical protein
MIYLKDYGTSNIGDEEDFNPEDFWEPEEEKKKKRKSESFKTWFWIKSLYLRSALNKTWKIWSLVFIFPIAVSIFKILVCGVLGLCEFDLSDNLEKLWLDFFFTGTLFDINAFRIHSFSFIVIFMFNYFITD